MVDRVHLWQNCVDVVSDIFVVSDECGRTEEYKNFSKTTTTDLHTTQISESVIGILHHL